MTRILVKLIVSIHELVILSARLFLRDKIQFYLDLLIYCFGPFVNVYRREQAMNAVKELNIRISGSASGPIISRIFMRRSLQRKKRTALTRSHMKFHPMIFQNMS